MRLTLHSAGNHSSVEIRYARASARALLWRHDMRTLTMAFVCSLAAAAAGCAPVGNTGDYTVGPDAGVDAATAGGPCNELVEKTLDLVITGASGFGGLPTTCWKLNGKLTLRGPAVTSLAKLGDLRGVTDLEIDDTDLTAIDTSARVDVTGNIHIHHNDRLADIANIAPKGMVDSIVVEYNAALPNLGGLAGAQRVVQQTTIANNAKLATIDLGGAQRLEGGLAVRDNVTLATLDLKSLQSAGAVAIISNPALQTITTTSILGNVHGSLTIDNNDALVTLGTLGASLIVDSGVVVTGNAKLTDLGGLTRAANVLGAVQITSNGALHPTTAHDVGCCVPTGAFTASSNMNASCSGDHWCLATRNCYR